MGYQKSHRIYVIVESEGFASFTRDSIFFSMATRHSWLEAHSEHLHLLPIDGARGETQMTWSEMISAASAGVAAMTFAVGVGTFAKAVIEYNRQTSSKRFEIFQAMNIRFDALEFKQLREMLDNDSEELIGADYTEKHNLLGFFEEVAVSVQSKVMSADVAFYFFGYYIIACYHSMNFWTGSKMIRRESPYWSLYKMFAERMLEKQNLLGDGAIDVSRLRF